MLRAAAAAPDLLAIRRTRRKEALNAMLRAAAAAPDLLAMRRAAFAAGQIGAVSAKAR